MRALPVPLAVTTLVAALALTACDSESGDGGKKAVGCPITVEVGPGNAATTAGDTGNVPVTLTHRGGGTCTFEGFPGVELHGAGADLKVPEEKGAKPVKVTLRKGETAAFTITYVRGRTGGRLSAAATTLTITVPGAGGPESHPWPYGEVSLKGPDVPDASVGPIQVAGD